MHNLLLLDDIFMSSNQCNNHSSFNRKYVVISSRSQIFRDALHCTVFAILLSKLVSEHDRSHFRNNTAKTLYLKKSELPTSISVSQVDSVNISKIKSQQVSRKMIHEVKESTIQEEIHEI